MARSQRIYYCDTDVNSRDTDCRKNTDRYADVDIDLCFIRAVLWCYYYVFFISNTASIPIIIASVSITGNPDII